jgi:hypothetical protein
MSAMKTTYFRRTMKFYEAMALIGGYQIAVFLIVNFILSAYRDRLYLTSMLKHLYQYDVPLTKPTHEEENFNIDDF